MNKYWKEQEAQVRDGGHLTHEDSAALFDWVRDLVMAIHFTMNEPTPHHWINVNKVLEAGPKEPE